MLKALRAFKVESRDDMAAANNPTITKPINPWGKWFNTKTGTARL